MRLSIVLALLALTIPAYSQDCVASDIFQLTGYQLESDTLLFQGYFTQDQEVDYALFYYTYDGENWQNMQQPVNDVFQAFITYHFQINLTLVNDVADIVGVILQMFDQGNDFWCYEAEI